MSAVTRLLALSASGAALGVSLMLLRRLTGRLLPSAFWYYAWLPVLLRMVLPLPGLIPVGAPEPALTASVRAEETDAGLRQRTVLLERESMFPNPGGEPDPEETDVPAETTPAPAEAKPQTQDAPAVDWHLAWTRARALITNPGFWLAVWWFGALVVILRYAAGYLRFHAALWRSLRTVDGGTARIYAGFRYARKPKLFRSAHVGAPILLGILRPLIVLPEEPLPPDTARNVLRHELTHYRRGDLPLKWFAVLVSAVHWFNPLMPLFRRELDRCCELSCDERLLRRMDADERNSYGETLLELAARRALPAGVVATTFAAAKRDLKERLVQIMKYRKPQKGIILVTVLAMLLLCGSALAIAPAREAAASPDAAPAPASESPAEAAAVDTIRVSTVNELLAAIGPDRTIVLAPGEYDLAEAESYGSGITTGSYRWEEVFDGWELVIENIEHLTITAEAGDPADTVISAVPRYADVIALRSCRDVELTGFTAGHTVEQGQCAGGVVHLTGSDDVTVNGCALYGCGVLGVEAEDCRNIHVSDTDIYECSNGAVWLTACRNVQFDRCSFRDCYNHNGGNSPAYQIFQFNSCYGVAIADSHVYGNYAGELVRVSYSQEVYLLGTLFEDNDASREAFLPYSGTVFSVTGDPITVAGCEFRDSFPVYAVSETSPAVDMDGNALSNDDLTAMKQSSVPFPGFAAMEAPEVEKTMNVSGVWEAHVSNVDELLAAIAPYTVIYLDEGVYDLTDAASYGSYGGDYYYWRTAFDGPGLVVTGVEGLTIIGAGKGLTSVVTDPRYADVLGFESCRNVAVLDLTAGHTLGAGGCAGSVLYFRGCDAVTVGGCGLFGCGILGIDAQACTGLTVESNEIYECSQGAVNLYRCAGVVLAENDIHDCAWPTYGIGESMEVTIDGEAVAEEALDAIDPFFTEYFAQEAGGDWIIRMIAEHDAVVLSADIDVPGAGPYKSAAASAN